MPVPLDAPGPTPAASAMPTYTPSPVPSPTPSGQSVSGNISAFTSGGSAGGGSVYFGQANQGFAGSMNPVVTGKPGGDVYNVFDPNAIVQLSGSYAAGPVYVSLQQAANMYYTWTPQQQDAFRAKMALIDSSYMTATDAQLAAAWGGSNGLVAQSAAYAAAGVNMTPWDILAKDIASNTGGKGKAGKDFERTITTQSHMSAPDANAIFTAAAQSLLGRAPTADELSAFRNNLYQVEAANPLVKTVNYHYLPGQSFYPTEDITKQSGGVSSEAAQNIALQQAKTNPEYGAYQAATTYMGALQELLSGGKV